MAQSPIGDSHLNVSDRSTLRRKRERGSHDRRLIDAILDEGLLCHVGFQADDLMFVQPMAYARIDDDLYLHGAAGNRMLRRLGEGADACVAVTLLDSIVFARSAFHHSMNYRSVMLFGSGVRVKQDSEMRRAVVALLDHMAPGRSADARPPTKEELRATLIVRFPIRDGSAKVRSDGPIEEPADLTLPIWAGQIPIASVAQQPVPDNQGNSVAIPDYIAHYANRHRAWAGPTQTDHSVVQPGG